MKELKKQISSLILSIATGSTDPVTFNTNVKTLNDVFETAFEHIEELEKNLLNVTTDRDKFKTDYDDLKEKYHEKWKNEDLNDEEKDFKKKEEVITEKDVIEELAQLSKKDEE